MKIFYQPGGEKGIIRWSLLLMFFLLGIIVQLEIFKTNIIAPVIMVFALLLIIWFIIKSCLIIKNGEITISSPITRHPKIIKINDIESVTSGKYFMVLHFKSSEFFPLRIIATPRSIKNLQSKIK